MANDRVFKLLNGFHRSVLSLTGGRLGWKAGGMTVVELTTTGRRSGVARTVLLTSPTQLAGAPVLVASRGGDQRHPDWYLNIEHDPAVLARIAGAASVSMHARIATPAERSELWPRIVAKYKNYAGYQARTSREIPLIILEPPSE